MRRAVALVVVCAAAVLAAAAPARAADFEMGMEDEGLLLSNQHLAPAAVQAWHALGVDVVRIHARWWVIAPGLNSRKPPRGFHASDPDDRHYDWTNLDAAVDMVRSAGMDVMLTITGPPPRWASGRPRKHNRLYKPQPRKFAQFARAVATRYRDQVDRYLIWNEPNQKGWLQPQWKCTRRHGYCRPVSPHIYRGLVRAATPAVHRADPGSEVVLGELAPIGHAPISNLTPMAPLPFLRTMGCVDARYRSIRTGACKHFRSAYADSFGYHPHPLKLAPDEHNPDRDEAQFGDLRRLFKVLDRLRHRHRLRIGRNVHLTEFGYQTSPPDRAVGIKLSLQTRYLQQAAYIAWKTKRVRGLSFYQWDDEPVVNLGRGTKRYAGWQTGLRFNSGRPKPVLSTMAAPFVVDRPRRAKKALLWGQVRPDAEPLVTVQMRRRGSHRWTDLMQLRTARDGTWSHRIKVPSRGATYRYEWTPVPNLFDPAPEPRTSGTVSLSKRTKSRLRASASNAK
ncbi:MAG TPA: cellulase family glycosylhydrolase [Solirubrobacter sp.]|nr:cellulase family glycosylhydrolase [Solirubrobacter sp.]